MKRALRTLATAAGLAALTSAVMAPSANAQESVDITPMGSKYGTCPDGRLACTLPIENVSGGTITVGISAAGGFSDNGYFMMNWMDTRGSCEGPLTFPKSYEITCHNMPAGNYILRVISNTSSTHWRIGASWA